MNKKIISLLGVALFIPGALAILSIITNAYVTGFSVATGGSIESVSFSTSFYTWAQTTDNQVVLNFSLTNEFPVKVIELEFNLNETSASQGSCVLDSSDVESIKLYRNNNMTQLNFSNLVVPPGITEYGIIVTLHNMHCPMNLNSNMNFSIVP